MLAMEAHTLTTPTGVKSEQQTILGTKMRRERGLPKGPSGADTAWLCDGRSFRDGIKPIKPIKPPVSVSVPAVAPKAPVTVLPVLPHKGDR